MNPTRQYKRADGFFLCNPAIVHMKWDTGLPLDGLIVHRAVTKDQEMFIKRMFEKIEDTFFLQQP